MSTVDPRADLAEQFDHASQYIETQAPHSDTASAKANLGQLKVRLFNLPGSDPRWRRLIAAYQKVDLLAMRQPIYTMLAKFCLDDFGDGSGIEAFIETLTVHLERYERPRRTGRPAP